MVSAGFCTPTPVVFQAPCQICKCNVDKTDGTITARLEVGPIRSQRAAGIAAVIVFGFHCLSPAGAVVSAPQCIQGEGPGCEASAAESPLIRELQEKSRANREKNDKATLEKYWQQGYGDYFSFGYNKELKKGEDGKWILEDPEDSFTGLKRRIEGLTKPSK